MNDHEPMHDVNTVEEHNDSADTDGGRADSNPPSETDKSTDAPNGRSGSKSEGGSRNNCGQPASMGNGAKTGRKTDKNTGSRKNQNPQSGSRTFISYIATKSGKSEADPDGLVHEARIQLEEKAIDAILRIDPHLQRTPTNQPGYDLFEANSDGHLIR